MSRYDMIEKLQSLKQNVHSKSLLLHVSGAVVAVIVWQLDLQLPMESVH